MKYTFFTMQGDTYVVNQYGIMKTDDHILIHSLNEYHEYGYEIEDVVAKTKISLDVVISKNRGIEGGFIGYLAFCPKVKVYSQSHGGILQEIREHLFNFNWDTHILDECRHQLCKKEYLLNSREKELLQKGIEPIKDHENAFPIKKRIFKLLGIKQEEK